MEKIVYSINCIDIIEGLAWRKMNLGSSFHKNQLIMDQRLKCKMKTYKTYKKQKKNIKTTYGLAMTF
jgi:hypothetical protein